MVNGEAKSSWSRQCVEGASGLSLPHEYRQRHVREYTFVTAIAGQT